MDALLYLTAECNYGGRVTDAYDRRLISSLLRVYYDKQMIDDASYKFCALDKYYAPSELSYDSFIEYIQNLPPDTHPEVFGLHANADITREYQETQQLFEGILLTLPRQVIFNLLFSFWFSSFKCLFNNRIITVVARVRI